MPLCLACSVYFIAHSFCFWLHWPLVAVLGLSLGVASWGLLFVVVLWLLGAEASLVSELRLHMGGLSSRASWAQLLRGVGDLPEEG